MSLQLKVGGYYRARGGKVVGPLRMQDNATYPFIWDKNEWAPNGSFFAGQAPAPARSQMDLIEDLNNVIDSVTGSPESTCAEIFELYNGLSDDAIDPMIELPAEDLHELALAYTAMREKLEAIMERLANSENSSREMRGEIVKVLRKEGA
jgi:hypothetical protein